jgi:hypothetical protein
MSTSPKRRQETPATPVFYSVGGAEDVGCYTGENLPQDAQQRICRPAAASVRPSAFTLRGVRAL